MNTTFTRTLILALVIAGGLTATFHTALADPVDLRGTSGVVKDLKQYDPPQRGLHINEPPSPGH